MSEGISMARFLFSQIKGTSISFNLNADSLHFDSGSAADVSVTVSGNDLVFALGSDRVTLLNVRNLGNVTTSKVTFSDGSLLLVGDNTTATNRDSAANTLTGGAGNDRLIGLGGNDTLDGREGSDTYVVTEANDGFDIYRDTGVTGTDRIVAGTSNATIRLGPEFSAALTGIEAISSGGYAGTRILGTSNADTLDFSGVSLIGLTVIDASSGGDTVTGSDAGDVVLAGSGNDSVQGQGGADTVTGGAGTDVIDGGDGRDVAVFAGTRASYSVTNSGGSIVVTDLDATANGNDGADTLTNVEILQFLDVTIDLTPPSPPPPVVTNSAPVAREDVASVAANGGPITVNVLVNDTDVDIGDTMAVVSVDGSGRPSEIVITSHPSQVVTTFIVLPAIPAIQGSVSVAPGGQSIIYTPTSALQALRAGELLYERIFYTISDRSGAQSTSSATVTVTGVNDGPVAAGDSVSVAKNSLPVTIDVLANDRDVDAGDSKTVLSVNTAGTLGSVAIATGGGNVVYTVGNAFAGLASGTTATDSFSYTMTDGFGAQSTALVTLTITGANSAPVAVADVAVATENGAAVAINVLANDTDVDVGDGKTVITVNNVGTQGAATIAADGSGVIYTIGGAFQGLRAGENATDTFTYTMRDNAGSLSSAAVTVTVTGVNDVLSAIADAAPALEDGGTVTLDVLANDIDADVGDTKSIMSITTTGLRGSAVIDGSNILYTPNHQYLRAGQSAVETFSYRAVDGAGSQSVATVAVTVIGANDAPVAVANAVTITEDAAVTSILVLTNDTDADAGDTKRVISVDRPAGMLGTPSISAGGDSVVYTAGSAFQHLLTGQSVVETFSYTMVDSAGAQSTATVTVTVNGATDGPKAGADTAATSEDGGAITLNVLANDTNDLDPGGQLTIASIDGVGWYTTLYVTGSATGNTQYGIHPGFPRLLGQATIAADGRTVLYTPLQSLNQGEVGTDMFHYKLTGGSSGAVSVTVTGANDAPSAVADAATATSDGGPVTISVLANDTDPDTRVDPPPPPADEELGPWDVTPVDVPDSKTVVAVNGAGLQGSVAIAPDGASVIYTPGGTLLGLAFGATAVETFTYTMQDGSGARSTASVSVTVAGVNHAPVAAADTAQATENGSPISINVLANDSDADIVGGDSLTLLSLGTAGLQGSAAINGGAITYTVGDAFQSLRAGVSGTDVFSYTVVDRGGQQTTANVTVTVTGVNDAPTAVADSLSISEDAAPVTINVLTNDTDADSGDAKSIVSLNVAGLQGTAVISGGGANIVYTVAPAFQTLLTGQTASESFTYTMADGSGVQSTATVSITITGANEPVVTVNPPLPPAGAIVGTAADDIINGTSGADVIYGQAGDDEIFAGGGNDTVFGGIDDDVIEGGAGNDILSGGAGRDDLVGDAGADTFRYYLVSESTSLEFDRIDDFSAAQGDKIDLNLIDANTILGGNNDFTLSSSFTGVAGQLVVVPNANGVWVQGDVNGDSIVDFLIEVRFASGTNLAATDFIL
jgi:VCBS repeat-containing protein